MADGFSERRVYRERLWRRMTRTLRGDLKQIGTSTARGILACLVLLPALDGLSCGQASAPAKSAEPTFRYSAIDNGDFTEPNTTVVDARGTRPIPWWRSSRG